MDPNTLYNQYSQPIYHTCLRILRNTQEAEESMQDAFVKLFSPGTPAFVNQAVLYAWLKKVAVRGAIDRLRSLDFRMETQATAAPDPETIPGLYSESYGDPQGEGDVQAEARRQVAAVKQALATLPSGYRTVLSLHLFEGYDMDEIATITHLQPSAVRSQYSRGRKKLQEAIQSI